MAIIDNNEVASKSFCIKFLANFSLFFEFYLETSPKKLRKKINIFFNKDEKTLKKDEKLLKKTKFANPNSRNVPYYFIKHLIPI